MKKILMVMLVLIGVTCFVGCGSTESGTTESSTNNGNESSNKEILKGNCSPIECIKLIEPENTVEEINEIMGFDGELTDEKWNEYYWEISETEGIRATYYSEKTSQIEVFTDEENLKNSKVDLSQVETLKNKVNDELVYYGQVKSYLGNVDGVLVEKGRWINTYWWMNDNGDYVLAAFSDDGNCLVISSEIK